MRPSSTPRSLALLLCLALQGVACGPPVDTGDGGVDAGPDGGGGEPVQVRVATFNTHLFFDDVCDSGACAPGDFEEQRSTSAFQTRAREIAAGIQGLGAQVVSLQEIENQKAFDAILAELPASFAHSTFGETGWPASLDVGLVSTVPLVGIRRHRDRVLERPDGTRTTFTREFLEVHLDADGHRLIVFCAHFRSKWQDDPGRREAEGAAAGEILAEAALANPAAGIVLAGDLNDVPGSPALDALEAAAQVERVAAELGSQDVTFEYQGTDYALDHLYLETSSAGTYRSGTVRVVRDGWGYAGSDHAAVRADFLVQ
ncbi:MAG: endonuclease/exonuclease/phosphatase family protein [Deltaproteobacteria bacterium]|nr:endonuclease/exonuclease/phosphatase family protein [Deltaproteobacteria bacterium]